MTTEENRAQQREYDARYRLRHPDKERERGERYRASEKGKENRAKYRQSRVQDPFKRRAQNAIARAIRDGKLVRQPCFCGELESHAHHFLGYEPEHWFNIVWLCRRHHKQAHLDALRGARP